MAVDLEKVKAFAAEFRVRLDGPEGEWEIWTDRTGHNCDSMLIHLEALIAEVEGLRAAAEAKEKAFQRLSDAYRRILEKLGPYV